MINLIGKGDFEKEKETGGTPIQWKDTVILPTVCFQDVLFGELIKTNFEARKMREKRIVAEMDSIGFGAGSVTSASPRDPSLSSEYTFSDPEVAPLGRSGNGSIWTVSNTRGKELSVY